METAQNPYYPAFLDLREKLCVVVGGGPVASRKIESLILAGARVQVVAPEVIEEITCMDHVEIRLKKYKKEDLKQAYLVIAATDDMDINRAVSQDAHSRRIFCNVVDIPDLCSFIVPSLIEKGPIKIAISTGGLSPALSKNLRKKIGFLIGDEYETLAAILGKVRPLILAQEGGHEAHKRIFDVLIDSHLLEAITKGDRLLVEDILYQALGIHIDLEEIV